MNHGLEIEPQGELQVLPSEEAQKLEDTWEAILFSKVRFRSKKEGILEALSERYPSLSGNEATQLYEAHRSLEYVVLDLAPAGKGAGISLNKPEDVNCSEYCVFPPNMAWIYACTHEGDWWGPFFARHPEYKKLNRRNELDIKKQAEIEMAKGEGWL